VNSEARKRGQDPTRMTIEVRVVEDPRMGKAILLQLPDAYIVTGAEDARRVAAALIGAADEIPEKAIEVQPCPECRAGKHANCDGRSWDFVADEPAPCPCWDADHETGGA
jgi:hypothetical protein